MKKTLFVFAALLASTSAFALEVTVAPTASVAVSSVGLGASTGLANGKNVTEAQEREDSIQHELNAADQAE